ncbi:redox-sensing transcriptional repressor Rex [Culicoidibacter larvae]|uniref:Redox-sensing transcriptional repressor Rex n=1 Tax=Culicoidibacter larvae TaxID=2579976 RepID=A0A5R8QDQ8_9FIRM|nr:redox-sensing transcriptional repressor Rex [Culicoidibacter larvae]TLG73907.1 redox-sensing transcriptional repressor Rex [Culicoidibacter larvae]
MKTEKLSRATARRLPQYYRQFLKLKEKGVTTINSAELEKIIKIEATTIRRDFSYIGELGKQRVGYNVDKVIAELRRFLGMDHDRGVILFGVGHLGTALVNYNYIKGNNVRIVASFDIDVDRTGTTIGDVPVYNINELEEHLPEGVNTAILALPNEVTQDVADRLVALGFRGFLNFSSHRLDVPSNVVVENIDLTSHLHTLMYLVNQETEKDNK